ncbi:MULTISPECIES: type II toxin-antitoxin system HicA family toxin [unclassified Microcoleus]|uniref:type II toxin-antitoxin system HicA family toxin n=1 Tax=unclassified Microcoleus TaxID=2642155 RepID=UPI001D7CDC14|nr:MULTISPECIES: type II toxin-antitoxin system HicA family toxin [unclassified Microcoleus]MCC3411596.1 type II toxin-antitoxin system HicA family toxin [Microcoleus sp. PH2017_02_FOX_O_A]MCC3516272.1 type II toxin-antitoxin system HicA family toxin [Microcoleus sp. PH2017_18_LLB_O_A]
MATGSKSSREIISRLRKEGWEEKVGCGKGNGTRHIHFVKEFKGQDGVVKKKVTVPDRTKDLPTGTLRAIYKQAGWDWSDR